MAHDRVWRPTGPIEWRKWDDRFVVFHSPSGDTHELSELGGCTLLTLAAHPLGLGVGDVIRRLASETRAVTPTDVLSVLEALAERGLVAPIAR